MSDKMTVPVDVELAAANAVKGLIADGVEHRATHMVLAAWFEARGIIIFDRSYNGGYIAQGDDGLPFETGEPYPAWNTYHEMIEAMLKRVSDTPHS